MKRDTKAGLGEFEVQGIRSLRQKAALLSGGNAQKLVLSRELRDHPTVVFAHNPSRGLDLRACAAVHRRLLAARDGGAAVLLISEDLDEIMLAVGPNWRVIARPHRRGNSASAVAGMRLDKR